MSLRAYAEAFERFAAPLPAAERAARGAHLQRFLSLGFPKKREEDWRYTDLAALDDKPFAVDDTKAAAALPAAIEGTERLVFINGRFENTAGNAADFRVGAIEAATSDDGLGALNAAFARDGLDLQLPAGAQRERPLHFLFLACADALPTMHHQRHRIVLGESAGATVIVEFSGESESERFATHTLEIRLAANARLRLYRLQSESAKTTLLTRCDARLARDARLEVLCIDAGAGFVRHDFNVSLDGPGAEVLLRGLYAPRAGAHIDNHTRIVHAAPQGRSREHFRGIVGERSRAVFSGKVIVQPGAQKTDSEQRVANLLLSRRAEVDAKPDLEIHADDVKCAHGATVGQLDDTALAYLRSRGIDAQTAKSLLLRAFASEVLDTIGFAPLRRHIEASLAFPFDPLAEAFGEAM